MVIDRKGMGTLVRQRTIDSLWCHHILQITSRNGAVFIPQREPCVIPESSDLANLTFCMLAAACDFSF